MMWTSIPAKYPLSLVKNYLMRQSYGASLSQHVGSTGVWAHQI